MNKSLDQKNILLCISGGIAAYKTPDLVRKLTLAGAQVRVVLTKHAASFVAPLALQAVSGHPVFGHDVVDPQVEAGMGHIELAKWADAVLVAPLTANTLAKITHGLADDLMTTLILATTAPLFLAPAMNQQMWAQAITRENMSKLISRGAFCIGPDSGEQACGDIGAGRMSEPSAIVNALQEQLRDPEDLDFYGVKVTITAGPTQEMIDPVRYISNRSSGKMGYAIAAELAGRGAAVTLISGPTSLQPPGQVFYVQVGSAEAMLNAVNQYTPLSDFFIGCAAVADYRVATPENHKIKKNGKSELTLALIENKDIISEVVLTKMAKKVIGFAAETQHVTSYAKRKLVSKGLDMIIANDVSHSDSGFDVDDNQVTLITADYEKELPLMNKSELAREIANHLKLWLAVEERSSPYLGLDI